MIDAHELEARGFAAWPAPRKILFGRWAFRLGGGYTKRANSANALAAGCESADEMRAVIAEAERVYAAEGLPPLFRVTPVAGPHADAALATAGYTAFDPCTVMTAALDAAESHAAVRIARAPEVAWLEGVADALNLAPPQRATHDAILSAIAPPAAFAAVFDRGETAGFGLAVCDKGAVGLFDIIVRAESRGRGIGRALTKALMAWGREAGATRAYLQIEAGNATARALYESLGYSDAYRYHYRRRA